MVEWQRRGSEVLITLSGLSADHTHTNTHCTPKLDKSILDTIRQIFIFHKLYQ